MEELEGQKNSRLKQSGNWKIVQGLELDDYAQGLIEKSTDELREERSAVEHLLG